MIAFRLLATFRAAAEERTFVEAARALHCSQSTVTVQVKQLEAELGTPLFTRIGKRATLNEAGRALYEETVSVLRHLEGIQQRITDFTSGEAGHVRLASIEPTASVRLPRLLAGYLSTRPKLRLTVEVGGARAVSQLVASGEADLGLASPPPAGLGLTFEPLFDEPLAVLVGAGHVLARKRTLEAKDLRGSRMLLTEAGCAYRAMLEAGLIGKGVNPYSGIEIASLEGLKRAVQSGIGIAILPACALRPPLARTVVKRLLRPRLSLTVGLLVKSGPALHSKSLVALMDLLRSGLRSRSERNASLRRATFSDLTPPHAARPSTGRLTQRTIRT